MKWPRISIAALMGGIFSIAIGFAALKNPTPLGANALATLLQGSLVIAILGAMLRRGPSRAFWIGFATCGTSYTLLAFDLSASPDRPQLVTVDLLVLLKDYLTGQPARWDVALDWMTTANRVDWKLFAQTGHSLFALMIAVIGGLLGRFFADRNP